MTEPTREEIPLQRLPEILKNPEKLKTEKTQGQNTIFIFDKMPLFKIDESGRLSQACIRSCHGVNEKWSELNDAMGKLWSSLGLRELINDPTTCPDCSGSGWLGIDSSEATSHRVLGLIAGVFNGIDLPGGKGTLTGEEILNTVGVFQTGQHPESTYDPCE